MKKFVFLSSIFALCASRLCFAETTPGVLLLAHGGSPSWNRNIESIRAEIQKTQPVEIAFGMADPKEIQKAVDRLASKKVPKIVAVPLFISSHSEVMEQTRYVLGIRKEPAEEFLKAMHPGHAPHLLKRIRTKIPLVMTSALDDHPLVVRILLDRIKPLSREPSQESVILVGHGPVQDRDNELWLRSMGTLSQKLKQVMRFNTVEAATLRDDAPPRVKMESEKKLRILVQDLSRKSRVLILPLLISKNGIEDHIQKALEGTFYRWKGETLLPHPLITQWIQKMTETGSKMSNMRQYE